MKYLFSACLLFLIVNKIQAQEATISGIVKDMKTKEPLIGVNVSIDSSTIGTVTDVDGRYELKSSSGKVKVIFSYIGYDNIVESVNLKPNQKLTLDIDMGEAQSLLDEVVVTSSKFERKIGEETVSIDIIKPATLEKQNLNNVSDALQRSPGLTVVDNQVNIRGGSGWSYGAGTRVLLLMDDMPILQADAGFPSFSSIPVENIGQIEIIKGAASALYGSSAMNGIINFRTSYPTSEPHGKFSMFGTVYDNPNKKEVYGLLDAENQFTGVKVSEKVNKNWWELDSVLLKGVSLGSGLITVRDTTIANPYQTRPHEFGFNFKYAEKLGKAKKLDFILNGMLYKKQSHRWGEFEKRGRITVNLRYRINEKISVGVNTNIIASQSQTFFLWGGLGIYKYLPGAVTGIPTESRTFRATIDPFFRYVDSKGNSHKILTRYYRTSIDNTNNQDNASHYIYGEYQYQRKIDKWNFVITTGAVGNYVLSNAQLFGDTKHHGYNVAGYLQLDKKFWKRLNISYGFRFESNFIDGLKPETKPVSRIGINVECAKYTFVRASFGQGYRFPTIAELYVKTELSPTIAIGQNPSLKSEKGMSAELGIKQGIKLGRYFNAFVDVAAFYQQFKDMMEFNFVPGAGKYIIEAKSLNVGSTEIIGAELTLMGEGKIAKKFPSTITFGYTFIQPKFKNYDPTNKSDNGIADYNILKYRFRHLVNGTWDVSFGGFDFGTTIQYFSAMENYDYILGLLLPNTFQFNYGKYKDNWESKKPAFRQKGDFILSLRTAYNFGKDKNFKLSFVVNNVTNREYTSRTGLIEAPRNYGFRFDTTF